MRKKNTKFVPLSNEKLRKVILGASIVVGGFVIASGSAYADKQDEVVNAGNVISSDTNELALNNDREDSLEISEDAPKERVAANNEKQEVEVTDETKTPDESDKVSDIDETVINKSGEFIGKENGQTSLSGDKDIASKEDLDKKVTVDEFNEKTRAEKEAELNSKISENEKKIEEINDSIKERNQTRKDDLINQFENTFKDDLKALEKYDYYGITFSGNNYYGFDSSKIGYEKSHNMDWDYYYVRNNSNDPHTDMFLNKDKYSGISRRDYIYNEKTNMHYFIFAYKKPNYGGSKELDDYVEKHNLLGRLDAFFDSYKDKYYALDKKYYGDSINEEFEINEKNRKLENNLHFNRNKFYAKITEDTLRPNKVEIIKDPTIWEGSFRWERYSKDGYIKTLIQNDKEVAKRVVHPLLGIKRVGTKTEEVRERRETESSTYDVIERPTTSKDEDRKVVQEGSDGLVEKVYDATYDKFSNVVKKELKDTIVKKEKKDRIVLRYGIKEETKTPVTLYDGIKNYDKDEKKIKDYSESERYRSTDLQPGNVNQELGKDDEKVEKDGFKFELKNPSETSPSKTEYGYQITIDKETGQRTYTKIYVSDSGLIPVASGDKPMLGQGDKLTPESPNITYKPTEDSDVSNAGRQHNLNYEASEETLKHINNKDNSSTSFGMKDNYTQENPRIKFFKNNFALGYWVNPYPNENDKLEALKLSKTYDKKEYVKGQLIKTDIKISNLDENAKERLVGQVYNPVTGEVVKEANAYLGDDGYVYIKMPDGVINEDGSENKDSIFNKPEYKGLQNLDVKFFARPRTKDEFKKIAETPDESGDTGTYTETGAGSKFINHKGKEVEVDLQGIDRYDHYNLIGSFKLQLDDTRYYDQNFLGSDKKDTTTHTSIPILPGQEFNVKVYLPEDKKDSKTQKSDLDIKDDEKKAVLIGKIDKKFIEKYNKDKKDADKWIIKDDDITKFTIIPPKTAKAGDFMAVPIEYTYTNGSKDVHWFHFVVQGSSNNVPSYQTKVGYQGDKLVSDINISNSEEDLKKDQPLSYELVDDQYIDNAGNRWSDVKIDPKTGKITATVPKDVKINGGEILTVGVKVNYKDKFGIEKEEIVKAEFVARPKYDGKFNYTEYDDIPFETEIKVDNTLKAGEIKVIQEGELGKKSREITQTYENDKLSDQVVGDFKTIKEPKKKIISVGSMSDGIHEYKEQIPFKYTVKEDPTLSRGKWVEDVKGVVGEKTTKWNIVNSKIVGEPFVEETKKPIDAVIRVGTGSLNGNLTIEETNIVQYETKVEFDDSLPAGKTVITGGEVGEKKRNVNLTIVDGNVTNEEYGDYTQTKAPVDKIIKVGSKTEGKHTYTEKIPFETKVEINPELKKGEWRYKKINDVEQKGVLGEKTTTLTIENSKVVDIKEETKDKVDAIIEVGSGDFTGTISHQVKTEKAFEVEIIENPNLTAGTHNIKQKGVKGETVTEYSQKIKNGEPIGEMTSKEISSKDSVKQIIEIGTKPSENNKDITNETKVKIEYVYDNTLDKGVVKNGELVKGNVTTKIVNEYNPKTGKIETVEKTVVTDAVQKIIVGTKDFTGEFNHTETLKTEYETEIVFDSSLKAGESKIVQKGELGEKTREITQKFVNGNVGEKVVGEYKEVKKPIKQIIKVGSMTDGKHSHKEEIPFDYEISYDKNLKSGEYVIDVKGRAGEKTTTWKIVNSKVVETKEDIKDPVNAIIRVGNKDFTGKIFFEHTDKIPFDVEVREDKTLKKGEKKILQQGVAGEKYYKYSQNIVNGKADGEKELVEEKITKEAVKEIVLVGVGENTGETKKVIERDIPFETKIIYDEKLDSGSSVVEKEGKLGKERVTITTTIKDGTGESTESVEKISDKEDRIIRIGIKPILREVELGFNTIYKHNKDLKDGELKTIKEGVTGKVVTKIFYNKETGKLETTDTETKPIDKIVEYGSKTEGVVKIKSEIPFEVEIIEDENLKSGEVVVQQEGKLGEKETTLTIENSKEINRKEEILKKPVKKIVRVGIKCDTCPIVPDEKPKEDPKDNPKEEPKEDPKEEPKEDSKEHSKKNPKEEPKEDPKEKPKEDAKSESKEESKGDSEKHSKEGSKDESKENLGEKPKEEPKETSKVNSNKKLEEESKQKNDIVQIAKKTVNENQGKKHLPKAGYVNETAMLSISGLLSSLGALLIFKKKRK